MFKFKKSKTKKMRGSNSHGWGHKKKHRGSGHRGGVGMAGTGDRADTKKPTILTKFGKSYFGKKGFTSILKKKNNVLSLSYIENNFDNMVERGEIVKEGDKYVFDASLLKVDKILGKGNFTKKLTIITKEISESAKQRVLDVGGEVILSSEKTEE
jgi:large subunit ribosomal protein L15